MLPQDFTLPYEDNQEAVKNTIKTIDTLIFEDLQPDSDNEMRNLIHGLNLIIASLSTQIGPPKKEV